MRRAYGLLVSVSVAAATLGFAGCGSEEAGSAGEDARRDDDGEGGGTLPRADASLPDVADDLATGRDVGPGETFCDNLRESSSPPRFCADFDDPETRKGWDALTVSPATATLGSDPNQSVSAPLSLVTTTKALADGDGANVSLRTTLTAMVAHPKLQFQARFKRTAFSGGSVVVARVNVTLSDHFFNLYLYDPQAKPPGPSLEETANGMTVHHALSAVPPVDTWVNTVVDLDLTAGVANVSFGAAKVLVAEPIVKLVGTEATIRIGAVYLTGPLPDFTANFDNVTLDF